MAFFIPGVPLSHCLALNSSSSHSFPGHSTPLTAYSTILQDQCGSQMPRSGHHKSRKGCVECKRRHVKVCHNSDQPEKSTLTFGSVTRRDQHVRDVTTRNESACMEICNWCILPLWHQGLSSVRPQHAHLRQNYQAMPPQALQQSQSLGLHLKVSTLLISYSFTISNIRLVRQLDETQIISKYTAGR